MLRVTRRWGCSPKEVGDGRRDPRLHLGLRVEVAGDQMGAMLAYAYGATQ